MDMEKVINKLKERFITNRKLDDDIIALLKNQQEKIENLEQKAQCMMRGMFLLKEQEDALTQMRLKNEELMKRCAELLKEQEARELTTEEWQEWKKDKNHDPICLLWEHDCTPIWILDANHVHEPALLMGKCKLFNRKPSHEQCKGVKWHE